jgi:hypothetical protein
MWESSKGIQSALNCLHVEKINGETKLWVVRMIRGFALNSHRQQNTFRSVNHFTALINLALAR